MEKFSCQFKSANGLLGSAIGSRAYLHLYRIFHSTTKRTTKTKRKNKLRRTLIEAVKTIIDALKTFRMFNCAFPQRPLFDLQPVIIETRYLVDRRNSKLQILG